MQSLVATAVGVQKITGIGVADTRDGKPYDTLAATEVHFIFDPQLLNLLFPTFGLSLSFEIFWSSSSSYVEPECWVWPPNLFKQYLYVLEH